MHASILKYFVAVARTGSIHKASAELHIATSALSRQIKKLEDELAIPLFDRLSSGLRLTQAGEQVLRHATSTLHEFDQLRGTLGAMQGKLVGRVRIMCLDSLMVSFLPEQLAQFHHAHPDVSFHVQATGHGHISNAIATGEADLGITFDLDRCDGTQMLHRVPMPLVVCVSANHPLVKRKSLSLSECAQYKLLLQADTQPIRSLIDIELSLFARIGRPFLVSNLQALLKPFIIQGEGVAFFTPLGFMDEILRGDIVPIPISESRLRDLHMGILIQKRWKLTRSAEVVALALGQALQQYSDTVVRLLRR